MKKLFLYLILISCVSFSAQAQFGKKPFFNTLYSTKAAQPPVDLVIAFWGQSNAGDRGNTGAAGTDRLSTTAYASYIGTYSNTHYIDNLVVGPVHPYITRLVYTRGDGDMCGADIGIVANLSSKFQSIEIIKYFVGGTGLKAVAGLDFNPNSVDEGYNQGFYKSDGSSFTQVNLPATLKTKPTAIVWIQGEQDANITSTTYLTDLTDFVNAIRTAYGDQNIPFFYNQLHVNYRFVNGAYEVPDGNTNIRAAQSAFQSYKNIMINMDDVAMNDPDGVAVHYNTAPLAEMGKRFAAAIKTYYKIP